MISEVVTREHKLIHYIIQLFRTRGHLVSTLDPLNIVRSEEMKQERLHKHIMQYFHLPEEQNFKYVCSRDEHICGGKSDMPVKDLIKRLEEVYCGNIGYEYMHITDVKKLEFIIKRIETPGAHCMTDEHKRLILQRLIRAHNFEITLEKKYPGETRFGLEGVEVMIPALRIMIDTASSMGVEVFNFGTSHRGRLNTLANVIKKPLRDIFAQFRPIEEDHGSGDIKYHLGTEVRKMNSVSKRPMTMSIMSNPSHLESVNPIVIGKTFADQERLGDSEGQKAWCVMVHGDASFTGQGVVYETFHLSELPKYTVNGCMHIILNNQIGFTTDPRFSRSSEYCTGAAQTQPVPIFHVNGDDPNAVCFVIKLATEYKHTFKSGVVVDLVCYRKHGHNEGDDPRFTQPIMYNVISKLKSIERKYADELIAENVVTEDEVQAMDKKSTDWFNKGIAEAEKVTTFRKRDWLEAPWEGIGKKEYPPLDMPTTGVSRDVLLAVGEAVSTVPPDFDMHPRLVDILNARKEMIDNNMADFPLAEAFAFGSLMKEGINVRLMGQDVERGTFSQRHHVYFDQTRDKVVFLPLQKPFPDGGNYQVHNSSLSEYGVLGFQLGYSIITPDSLVIWEIPFGDFANNAQIIIDQFISSGEQKWGRQTGIVLQLPHGLEGGGPEHSSARPERYLQMCYEKEWFLDNPAQQMVNANWFIVNPSTPANLFHALRRQQKLNFRKPLILFTPKKILFNPEARSCLEEMTGDTTLRWYITDEEIANPERVEKVFLCTGRIYYTLKADRERRGLEDTVAICRVEQHFPFPYGEVKEDLKRFPNAKLCWVQEEPRGQGWWDFLKPRLKHVLRGRKIWFYGRPASATTTASSIVILKKEMEHILDQCF